MDKLTVKVLGTPIGGVSQIDGDGDGFRTGPDGEDNVPAVTSIVKPLTKTPQKNGFGEMFKNAKAKMGKRSVKDPVSKRDNRGFGWASIAKPKSETDAESSTKVNKIVNADAIDILESAHEDRLLIGVLRQEFHQDQKFHEAVEEKKEEWLSAVKRVKQVLFGEEEKDIAPYGKIDNHYARAVVKARITAQLATDMERLGITDADAYDFVAMHDFVLEKLAGYKPKKGQKADPVSTILKEFIDESVSGLRENPENDMMNRDKMTKLSRILIEQWAWSANNHSPLSLLIQQRAETIIPQLKGGPHNKKFLNTNIFKNGDVEIAQKIADIMGEEERITKVIDAFITAQYVRTQEYFEERGIKEIRLFRGQVGGEPYQKLQQAAMKIPGGKDTYRMEQQLMEMNRQMIKNRRYREDKFGGWQNWKKKFADGDVEARRLFDEHEKLREQLEDLEKRLASIRRAQGEIVLNEDGGLRPLSSFTTNIFTASDFASNEGGVVLTTVVDARDIVATALTGAGCLQENEMIINAPVVNAEIALRVDALLKKYGKPKEYEKYL